jgi:thioredoxin-like negative regulator of GroEL
MEGLFIPCREGPLRKTALVLQAMLVLVFGISAALPLWASAAFEDELVSLATSGRKPVIADFGMGFCQQCKKQAATLDEIREAYGEKVIIRVVNVGKEADLTKRYEVEWIPTLVFIDPKGKIVLKKVGPLGYEEIRTELSRMGVK